MGVDGLADIGVSGQSAGGSTARVSYVATPTLDEIRQAPKVLLHDHLDGGLRPETIIDLAGPAGVELPATSPAELATWFTTAADSGSLERYLKTFDYTVAVLQTASALRRVAAECALDLAADGVVYAEVRFAPEQHLRSGLRLPEVVEAVLAGFVEGSRQAADAGRPIRVGALLCGMRHAQRSLEIAELTVRYRDAGVVGFDIAGAEVGHPPTDQLAAFQYLKGENMPFTVHAGEAAGTESIWQALQVCGANRIGHGVRIIEDVDPASGELGRLAAYVRDQRIPLELCPSSNVQTGAAASIAEHPFGQLQQRYFQVTVNTDNRLMSGTTLSRELALLSAAFGYRWRDLELFARNAMASAFLPFPERQEIIDGVLIPSYAKLRAPDERIDREV